MDAGGRKGVEKRDRERESFIFSFLAPHPSVFNQVCVCVFGLVSLASWSEEGNMLVRKNFVRHIYTKMV